MTRRTAGWTAPALVELLHTKGQRSWMVDAVIDKAQAAIMMARRECNPKESPFSQS